MSRRVSDKRFATGRPGRPGVALSGFVAGAILLSGCTSLPGLSTLDRDYRLRLWERLRVSSDFFYRKHDYKTAAKRARDAVSEAESFGPSDFRLGVSLYGLGKALKAKGDLEASADVLARAAAVFGGAPSVDALERKLNRQEQARSLSLLGQVCLAAQEKSKARNAFRQASSIYAELCQPVGGQMEDFLVGHEYVKCLYDLAQADLLLDDKEAAVANLSSALKLVDDSHYPELLARRIRVALVGLLKELGREREAAVVCADEAWLKHIFAGQDAEHRRDYQRAESSYKEAFLEAARLNNTVRVVKSLSYLAEAYAAQFKHAEMGKVIDRALAQYEARPDTKAREIDSVYKLAVFLRMNTGSPLDALPLLNKWYEYRVARFGSKSLPVVEVLCLSVTTQILIGQNDEARKTAMVAYSNLYPDNCLSKQGSDLAYQLAVNLTSLGENKSAANLLREALRFNLKRRGSDSYPVFADRMALASSLCRCGQKKEAGAIVDDMLRDSKTSGFNASYLVPLLSCARDCFIAGLNKRADRLYDLCEQICLREPAEKLGRYASAAEVEKMKKEHLLLKARMKGKEK